MHSRTPAAAATPEQLAVVDATIGRLEHQRGACLPILIAIQEELGFVPHESLLRVAKALNLSRADVHGVLTYYHELRSAPPGRHVLRICRAEACRAMGCERLEAHAKEHLAPFGETSADGRVTVEATYCLGNCALSPSVQIDGRVFGRVSPQRLDALLAAADAHEARP
jgi:formate dehydrogenase subunit gamma